MRTNMLHSNLLGRLGNGLLKFVVLVVMTCNMSGAFADNIWADGGRFPSSQSIGGTITISSGKEVIVDGNLTLNGNAVLTISENSVLIVKGSLTITKQATLAINDNAELYVFLNLTQEGQTKTNWLGIPRETNTGDLVMSNPGKIVVGGNYTVHTHEGWLTGTEYYDDDNQYIHPGENVYIFGSNNLSDINISTENLKNGGDFQNDTGFSSISSFLPIELTSFTVSATEYGYTFNWVTASEVENDYFTLEYSIDGVDFNEIDYVHGAGTTSETSEYEYRWDEAPEFDVVYFRLKQTDYNGEYSYSDVIVASRKKSSGANGTFRYGPLNLQIQDGELRYIVK